MRMSRDELSALLAGGRGKAAVQVRKRTMCSAPALKKSGTKTEETVRAWLESEGYRIVTQPTNLFPMAGGGRYTPDFLAWKDDENGILVVEAKQEGAHYRGYEQGYERYKRCASQYDSRQWRFAMATVLKGGRGIQLDIWTEMPGK